MSVYYGLHPQVRFREDLGFVFLDDGSRIYKMEAAFFDRIRKGHWGNEEELILQRMPSVFSTLNREEAASESYRNKAI